MQFAEFEDNIAEKLRSYKLQVNVSVRQYVEKSLEKGGLEKSQLNQYTEWVMNGAFFNFNADTCTEVNPSKLEELKDVYNRYKNIRYDYSLLLLSVPVSFNTHKLSDEGLSSPKQKADDDFFKSIGLTEGFFDQATNTGSFKSDKLLHTLLGKKTYDSRLGYLEQFLARMTNKLQDVALESGKKLTMDDFGTLKFRCKVKDDTDDYYNKKHFSFSDVTYTFSARQDDFFRREQFSEMLDIFPISLAKRNRDGISYEEKSATVFSKEDVCKAIERFSKTARKSYAAFIILNGHGGFHETDNLEKMPLIPLYDQDASISFKEFVKCAQQIEDLAGPWIYDGCPCPPDHIEIVGAQCYSHLMGQYSRPPPCQSVIRCLSNDAASKQTHNVWIEKGYVTIIHLELNDWAKEKAECAELAKKMEKMKIDRNNIKQLYLECDPVSPESNDKTTVPSTEVTGTEMATYPRQEDTAQDPKSFQE